MSDLAIIIPVLNEAGSVGIQLEALSPLRTRGAQIVVVDGGSTDGTAARAEKGADLVVVAPPGRASQMNAGASIARGETLLFLHVDTMLPPEADFLVETALASSARRWGRFDVRIVPETWPLGMVAMAMNWRSRLTGIATGDQAIFVRSAAFSAVGGFPDIPLMEDIALSKRLKHLGRPICLREAVSTSGRRWQKQGVARTIVLMWYLRLAYFFGADPHVLAKRYGYVPTAR